MDLKTQRAAAIKAAQEIIGKSERTDEDRDELIRLDAEIKSLNQRIDAAKEDEELIDRLNSFGAPEGGDSDREAKAAKSLGEHFVKHIGADGLSRVKTVTGAVAAAPEFKAADDTHSTPGGAVAPWLTEYDRTVVRAFRRPVVSDLFGAGTIGDGSNAISYLVEGAVDGALATVAEAGTKPQFHVSDPTPKTDPLRKIAGVLKFTDEMIEDAAFLVSEINERGLYLLALEEENQLLNGSGSGSQIEGLLKRSGIQTETAASADDVPDALFRAASKVQTATGLTADALVINPADYQALRLRKDGNSQYYGGGFFTGQYGNGDIDWQPPVWGLRTVVSAAVAAGNAVVGAFGTAATVYRKGGVRVESTNSHADDFTNNLVTTRIEERIALAVRIPAAFVSVNLSGEEG